MYLDFVDVEKTVTGTKAINNALTNILMTKKGSVPGKPEFGSNIHNLLFNQLDHITKSLLKTYIREAINEFEPRVLISKTIIKDIPEYNKVIANITYSYRDKGIELNGSLNVPISQ